MDMRIPDLPPAWAVERTLPFEFRGTAREYFGIWIVNLFLSIVTIGIYTAWAKVRRLRYFYGNTFLDGHNFEYHASGRQILVGRVIVVALLVAYSGLNAVHPAFALLFVPYLIAFPWLLNKSMAFNARMTSYRNVRLSFGGTYWGALGVFVLMPFAAILTLGLLAPLSSRLSSNYIGRHLKFGAAQFSTNAPAATLYANLGLAALLALLLAAGAGVAGFAGGTLLSQANGSGLAGENTELGDLLAAGDIFGAVLGLYLGLGAAYLFYAAGVRNVAFNATTLEGGHRLVSTVGRLRYVWILVSNLVVTLLTLTLMRPWAAVRTWRYLADSTSVVTTGSMDSFVDEQAAKGAVAAAEFFDIEGIDFGL